MYKSLRNIQSVKIAGTNPKNNRHIKWSSGTTGSWRKITLSWSHALYRSLVMQASGISTKFNMVMHKCSIHASRLYENISNTSTKRASLYRVSIQGVQVWSMCEKVNHIILTTPKELCHLCLQSYEVYQGWYMTKHVVFLSKLKVKETKSQEDHFDHVDGQAESAQCKNQALKKSCSVSIVVSCICLEFSAVKALKKMLITL